MDIYKIREIVLESAPRVLIRSKGVDFNKMQGALYA